MSSCEEGEKTMKTTYKLGLLLIALTLAFGLTLSLPAQALSLPDIGDLLMSAAIVAAVMHYSDDINNFVNKLLLQNNVEVKQATKVVPIVSAGSGIAVGAVQVVGSQELLKKVKAVGQFEARFGIFRGKLLLPVSSSNPTKSKVVKGVGVSAIIDVRVGLL
jgi:hypothetical protein